MAIEFESNLDNVLEALTEAELETLEKIGMLGEAAVKLNTPVATGTLRRSITNQVDESEKKVDIGTNVEYAKYVEDKKSFLKDTILNNISEIEKIVGKSFEVKFNGGD